MVYNPLTDFLGLIRNTGGQAALAEMPGLDYVVAALARAGFISLSVGQNPPLANQPTTVWLKPSLPSWVAEGIVYLWDTASGTYLPATPALWIALLVTPSFGTVFQSVAGATGLVASATTLLAIQRAAPAATTITLPAVATRSRPLQLVDWSSGVVNHSIILLPAGAETIMRLGSFQLLSTVDQLAGVTLYPSTDLSGWVIAP